MKFYLSEKFSYGDTEVVAVDENGKQYVFTIAPNGVIYDAKEVPFMESLTRPFVSHHWPAIPTDTIQRLTAGMPNADEMERLPLSGPWDFTQQGTTDPPTHITNG